MKVKLSTSATLGKDTSEQVEIKILIPAHCDAATNVPKLLSSLKFLGDVGASRGITIEDGSDLKSPNNGFIDKFGFDGDGSDKITAIYVNGVEYKQ